MDNVFIISIVVFLLILTLYICTFQRQPKYKIYFYFDGEVEEAKDQDFSWKPACRISSSTIVPKDLVEQVRAKLNRPILKIENWKQRHKLEYYEWDHKDVFQGYLVVYYK